MKLLCLAIGAFGVLLGGALLGISLCDQFAEGPYEGPPRFLWLWFLPCPFLFLFGAQESRRPLDITPLILAPVLISAGIDLSLEDRAGGRLLFWSGIVAPVVWHVFLGAWRRLRRSPMDASLVSREIER